MHKNILPTGAPNQHERSSDLLDATGFTGDVGATNASNTDNKTVVLCLGKRVKRERVRRAQGAVGAVMRRAGVGPQDAVQHAGAEPSV